MTYDVRMADLQEQHVAVVCDRLTMERIADSSHWVQNDAPDEVNRLLLRFFGSR